MRNDYLRRYLWMRNAVGIRAFYYETLITDQERVRALMKGEPDYHEQPEGGWYELVLWLVQLRPSSRRGSRPRGSLLTYPLVRLGCEGWA